MTAERAATPEQRIEQWFASRGWEPFEFQRQMWAAYRNGKSGLLHAPTGVGKTYAAWFGPTLDYLHQNPEQNGNTQPPPIRVLWITPLRALANDLCRSLLEPVESLQIPWSVQIRTGDTSTTVRKKQREHLPTTLITTPESLSLLLSYPDTAERFATLQCVIVDEWHELLGTKRGVQTELALARLRTLAPDLRAWGLSATIGNLEQAGDVLMGTTDRKQVEMISAPIEKRVEIETLIPESVDRFPWAGHLGLSLLDEVISAVDRAGTTLLFTNTRSQAEIWFRAIQRKRTDWIGKVVLHHGSIDRKLRREVEQLTRSGEIRCVVCTSSLDLGVDFSPVDQVIQVGSPKGIARLRQRAGRSGHQPGATSKVVCVPTHALELLEYSATRSAMAEDRIEDREPLTCPLDVLVQHLVTVAAGGGFTDHELLQEVRTTHAFRDLSDQQWQWAIDFVCRGGTTLSAYPQYLRIKREDGRYVVASPKIARLHRMGIGTITSDSAMMVRFVNGPKLGTIEESFIAKLKPGDSFVFAGRCLRLVQTRDMTAYVRKQTRFEGTVPRWMGGRMPLSTQLGQAMRSTFSHVKAGYGSDPELICIDPILKLQERWSHIPHADELLVETSHSRDGDHLFVFPFEGRLVHEGLGALFAFRLAQIEPRSVSVTATDYGFELLSPQPLTIDETIWHQLTATDRLAEDLLGCVNSTEMAKRQFRDIARVAGLVMTGFPGQNKSTRQLQASSELFYDVFAEFDPENLLLDQARREVLEQQLELRRLRAALERMSRATMVVRSTRRFSPLAFPIWAERIRGNHVSTEKWADRVQRMVVRLEKAAQRESNQSKQHAKHGRKRNASHGS